LDFYPTKKLGNFSYYCLLQVDHKKGFGGKFGVESDRVDKTAAGYSEGGGQPVGTNYQRTRPEASSQGAKNLKSRFEDMARSSEEDDRRRAEDERQRRQAREQKERSEAAERDKVSPCSVSCIFRISSWFFFWKMSHILPPSQCSEVQHLLRECLSVCSSVALMSPD